jgi:hypothetical protein
MYVRINQTWHRPAFGEVDDDRVTTCVRRVAGHGCDSPALDNYRGIPNRLTGNSVDQIEMLEHDRALRAAHDPGQHIAQRESKYDRNPPWAYMLRRPFEPV